MASSDDFKQQLKAGNFAKALAIAFSEAAELKITTWVSSDSDDINSTVAKPGHRLHTRINIIEGDIENEIGEQFIANNPYKELRQFHFEQVAEGNQIIQSNLKSLQKLFEVLVVKNHQASTTPVIEPQSSSLEGQLLPPVEPISTARLMLQPTESTLEESAMVADTVIEDLTDARLGIEPTETAVEESVMAANTVIEEELPQVNWVEQTESAAVEELTPVARKVIEEEVSQQQPSYSQLNSFAELPIAIPEASDSEIAQEDEEDWEDSVLDFMESLPVASPSTPEDSALEIDQDWGDLPIEESEPDLATENSELSQNWGAPTLEELNSLSATSEQEIEVSELEFDGDWDDWVIEEPNILPNEPVAEQSLLELQEEYDDWDDWVVEEPGNLTDVPVDDGLSSDLGTDEDWDMGEYSDPFTAEPALNNSMSDLDINEDWDEFVGEQRDIDPDIQELDTNFESSAPRKNLTSKDLAFYQTENSDLRENMEGDGANEYSGLLEELEDDLDFSPKPVEKKQPPNRSPKQNNK
jgi:hypothetical protein